jgi:serine protease Do
MQCSHSSRLPIRTTLLGALAVAAMLAAAPAQAQLSTSGAPAFDFTDVVQTVSPAVVAIQVTGEVPAQDIEGRAYMFPDVPEDHPLRPFFDDLERRYGARGGPQQEPAPPRQRRGQGSGFFISADGYVVTNNHVVEGASEVVVVDEDGEEYPAEIIGTDPRTDLALLKTDREDAPFVAFADPENIHVGQWVIAVGNPFGLGGTVTAGIVSALGRNINANAYDDFIQIDAPVNRGNSGGPAFDYNGNVIGVNTAIFSPSGGNVGIAFAIPASIAVEVIEDLRDDGEVSRGYLGVSLQPVSDDIAEALGLEDTSGALVAQATPDGPAAEAGIADGDIIAAVNGEAVTDSRELARTIAGFDPGETVTVTVFRDGESQDVEVELGELPADPE